MLTYYNAMQEYDIFIGLEIHVQLKTQSKMFCSCPNHFGEIQNTNICPVCLGYPGMMPVPNIKAIEYAYKIAHALHCALAPTVIFDRKNYYYPDLPKNYQISQFHNPVGRNGFFEYIHDNAIKQLRIHEAHLEEDAGKLIHSSDSSFCDYNRSGTPLMEIVTEPEIYSSMEAEEILKQFRRLMRYIDVCDGNMEEGSLRCDANISINHKGKGLGSKVEIKNVNSFKFIRSALEYEIERQSKLLQNNSPIVQETRLWNENRDMTESMRTKEISDDYRYFPEPDIIPLTLSNDFFDALKENEEENPAHRYMRIQESYNIEKDTLDFFIEEKSYIEYFEKVIQNGVNPKLVATWGSGDVKKLYNRHKLTFAQDPLNAQRLSQLLLLIQDGTLHGKLAKTVLEKVFEDDIDPVDIIEKYKLKELLIEELHTTVNTVLSKEVEAVRQYKDGKKKSFGFLMGEVMKKTNGRANPVQLKDILQKTLEQ